MSSADDRLRAAILTGGSDPIHMDGTRCPPDHACVHRDVERLTSELEGAKRLLREAGDRIVTHGGECGCYGREPGTCLLCRIDAFAAHPKGPEPMKCPHGYYGDETCVCDTPATPAQGESR